MKFLLLDDDTSIWFTRPGKRLQFATLTMAIEMSWVFPLNIVIFHSYVSLPEGRDLDDTVAMEK